MRFLCTLILVLSLPAHADFGPLAHYDRAVRFASSSGDNGPDVYLYLTDGRVYFQRANGEWIGQAEGYPLPEIQQESAALATRETRILNGGKRWKTMGAGLLTGTVSGVVIGVILDVVGTFVQVATMQRDHDGGTLLITGVTCFGAVMGTLIAGLEVRKPAACARRVNRVLEDLSTPSEVKEQTVFLLDADANETAHELTKCEGSLF